MARDSDVPAGDQGQVQQAYAAIITGGGAAVARRLYTDQELAEVPPGASSGPLGWATRSGTHSSSRARRA